MAKAKGLTGLLTSISLLLSTCYSLSIPAVSLRSIFPREDVVNYTTVSCDAQYVNDAGSDPVLRWKAAGADHLWAEIYLERLYEETNGQMSDRLGYTAWVSNWTNSKDSMNCQNMEDGPCSDTVTCDQVKHPAGMLVLNSFVNLHTFRKTIYTSLNDALGLMLTRMSTFQDTFSPEEKPSETFFKDLLTVFQTVVGIGSAYAWNIVIKEQKLFDNDNYRSFWKDSVNAAISGGFTSGREHVPDGQALQNELTTALGDFFESWTKAELGFLKSLFSDSSSGRTMLDGLVKDGMALFITKDLDLGEFVDDVQKIVYGKLATIAWSNLAKKPEVLPKKIYPMILMSDKDCVTTGDDLPNMIDEADAAKMAVCYDKKTFYVGYPEWKGTPRGGQLMDPKFKPLPGGTKDELSGGDKWKGLSLEDIVVSSFNGWKANGGKNGYVMPDYTTAEAQSGNLIGEDGIRTAGFLQLPMCTRNRLQQVTTQWQDNLMGHNNAKPIALPCSTGELYDSEKAAWGF